MRTLAALSLAGMALVLGGASVVGASQRLSLTHSQKSTPARHYTPPAGAATTRRTRDATNAAGDPSAGGTSASSASADPSVNAPSPLSMQVEPGWNAHYRGNPSWTPIRITLHNPADYALSGRVEIPDNTASQTATTSQTPVAFYQQGVLLPPSSTKQLTLFIPGNDVGNSLDVVFRDAHGIRARASVFPSQYQDRDISIGTLTSDPESTTWIARARLRAGTVHVVPLTAATLDAVPETLASFDAIVLTSFNSSRLDHQQLAALERYARNGGSLILVGGPDWQETLEPLPAYLLPGRLTGSRTLPDLSSLRSVMTSPGTLSGIRQLRRPTTVSILAAPTGAVLIWQKNVPLTVRMSLGTGVLEYLAFDPSVDPMSRWQGSPSFLGAVLSGAMPQAMRRLSLPFGYGSVSFLKPTYGPLTFNTQVVSRSDAITRIFFPLMLVVLYLLLVGPVDILALRRIGRPALIWIIIPVAALVFTVVAARVAPHISAGAAIVKSIGVVEADGGSGLYPTSQYVGMSAPSGRNYHLTVNTSALPSPVAPYSSSGPSTVPIGWRFEEGGQTVVDFQRHASDAPSAVGLRTTAAVSGAIHSHLRLNSSGGIVGTIRNDTALNLVRPVLIAGRRLLHLPDLLPHHQTAIRLQPDSDVHQRDYSPMLAHAYGQSVADASASAFAQEGNLSTRLRVAIGVLPEANVLSMVGEVYFAAWVEQPLDVLKLNGVTPRRRDLNLIVKPLSVDFPSGSFRLRTGTLGASFVDQVPAQPRYACCYPSAQGIYIGAGGSASFQFEIPRPGRVTFHHLTLSVYAGGPDASYTGYTDLSTGAAQVYDWRLDRWEDLKFRNGEATVDSPDSAISSTGTILLRLRALDDAHELVISDPYKDLQLSGIGGVR